MDNLHYKKDGKAFIDDLLHFWRERLADCVATRVLTKEDKEEIEVIDGLLHIDAPYRLWEECQRGFIHKDTILEVAKVDEAIFKLRSRVLRLPDALRDEMVQFAVNCESLLVFCICNGLRKEGRLVE